MVQIPNCTASTHDSALLGICKTLPHYAISFITGFIQCDQYVCCLEVSEVLARFYVFFLISQPCDKSTYIINNTIVYF